jgi:hypothetical protein
MGEQADIAEAVATLEAHDDYQTARSKPLPRRTNSGQAAGIGSRGATIRMHQSTMDREWGLWYRCKRCRAALAIKRRALDKGQKGNNRMVGKAFKAEADIALAGEIEVRRELAAIKRLGRADQGQDNVAPSA